MRKEEFLNELKEKLKGLPKDDLENRLSFYEEMINDRMDEGKSEEEAVNEIGSVDEVVNQIAQETPLIKLVKEKTKPKRALKAWEIVLIIVGFPIWLPLLIVAFILCLVAYLLIWVWVLVTYAVEIAFIGYGLASFISFFARLSEAPDYSYLGFAIASIGASILFLFACIGATKLTLKLSKFILVKIKTAFMRKETK